MNTPDSKDPRFAQHANLHLDGIDESKFVTQQIGFAPYWTPYVVCSECGDRLAEKQPSCPKHPTAPLLGSKAIGVLLNRDPRDPNFVRWVFQAKTRLICHRGPQEDDETVIVQPGEFFSMSEYAGLRDALPLYLGCTVLIKVLHKRELPPSPTSGGKPRTFWEFSLGVDETVAKLMNDRRLALAEEAQRSAMATLNAPRNGAPSAAMPATATPPSPQS